MIQIGGIQKTTLLDYPGRVAATVFLIGCNFRCPFCYSAELVLPEAIKKQPKIPEKEFFSFLNRRKGLLEGIVICGGEPTIHKDLPRFIKKIKKMGYLVKLDTNGSNPELLKQIIDSKLIDYVAMDIKAPKEKVNNIVGIKISMDKIQKSINLLKKGNIDYEFRTTIVPQLHTKEDIVLIANWIGPDRKYYLQNFMPQKTINPEFIKIKPYPLEYLQGIKKEISHLFDICQIR